MKGILTFAIFVLAMFFCVAAIYNVNYYMNYTHNNVIARQIERDFKMDFDALGIESLNLCSGDSGSERSMFGPGVEPYLIVQESSCAYPFDDEYGINAPVSSREYDLLISVSIEYNAVEGFIVNVPKDAFEKITVGRFYDILRGPMTRYIKKSKNIAKNRQSWLEMGGA